MDVDCTCNFPSCHVLSKCVLLKKNKNPGLLRFLQLWQCCKADALTGCVACVHPLIHCNKVNQRTGNSKFSELYHM